MDDDQIIALAGAGTALVTYAGIAGGVEVASGVIEAAKKVVNVLNPATMILGKTWKKKDSSWSPKIPSLIGLSVVEIGALGAAMCAAAAIMWEMKHPYMGEAYEQFQKWQNEKRDDAREAVKAIMDRLPEIIEAKADASTAQIEAVSKVLPELLMLAA